MMQNYYSTFQNCFLFRQATEYLIGNSEQFYCSQDTSHTGQVGTALYVAPELNTYGPKATYNQVNKFFVKIEE